MITGSSFFVSYFLYELGFAWALAYGPLFLPFGLYGFLINLLILLLYFLPYCWASSYYWASLPSGHQHHDLWNKYLNNKFFWEHLNNKFKWLITNISLKQITQMFLWQWISDIYYKKNSQNDRCLIKPTINKRKNFKYYLVAPQLTKHV